MLTVQMHDFYVVDKLYHFAIRTENFKIIYSFLICLIYFRIITMSPVTSRQFRKLIEYPNNCSCFY